MLKILQVSKVAKIFAIIHFVLPELCNIVSENAYDDCNAFALEMGVQRDFGELRIALP